MITGEHMVTRRPGVVAVAAAPVAKPAPARHIKLHPVQVVCWQLAAAAVVVTVAEPWPLLTIVSVAAAVVLTLTGLRMRHRWLYEWAGRYLRYAVRGRRHAPRGPRALLDLLAPGATVQEVTVNDLSVGVISTPDGVTAVLHPRMLGVHALLTPASLLPEAADQPVPFGVQVVAHAGLRRTQAPLVWIAVHAERTVDLHHDDDLTQVLGNTLRRTIRKLARENLAVDAVTADELLSTVTALGHVNAGPGVREDWRYWCTGPVGQVTLRIDGWDRLPPQSALLLLDHALAAAPGTAVTVTRSAQSSGNGAVVRIAATGAAVLEASVTTMTRLAEHFGVRMDRLDGMHPTGVAASLPIGGFLV
jgi:hypothetical protein